MSTKKVNANVKDEVVETTAETVVENEEVVEEVSLGTKIVTGVKKHGKKILTGIGIIAAIGVGYVLGSKGDDEDDFDFSYEPEEDDNVDAFAAFDQVESEEEV